MNPTPMFEEESHDKTGGYSYGFDELMERANDVMPGHSSTQSPRSVPFTPTFNEERNKSICVKGYDVGDLMEQTLVQPLHKRPMQRAWGIARKNLDDESQESEYEQEYDIDT